MTQEQEPGASSPEFKGLTDMQLVMWEANLGFHKSDPDQLAKLAAELALRKVEPFSLKDIQERVDALTDRLGLVIPHVEPVVPVGPPQKPKRRLSREKPATVRDTTGILRR